MREEARDNAFGRRRSCFADSRLEATPAPNAVEVKIVVRRGTDR